MQIERFAIRVAARGSAYFDKFFNFRMVNRQIHRRRAAPQGALRDSQRQAVHNANERNNTGGFAILTDALTDRTQIAPIAANAAATRGQPDIFIPQIDNIAEAVIGFVQKAGNRQPAIRAAIGQDRGGGHEPEF